MKMKYRSLLLIVLCIAFIGTANTYFYHKDSFVVQASSIGTVTASSLNVRSGAGTNYGILLNNGAKVSLKKGDQVTILKAVKDWYFVSFQYNKSTIKGYVINSYVTAKTAVTPSATPTIAVTTSTATGTTDTGLSIPAKVIATKLNVRLKASTTAGKLTIKGTSVSLVKNQAITILTEKTVSGKKWYYVSFLYKNVKRKGYVMADYIKLTLSKTVQAKIKSSTAVKVLAKAGSNSYVKASTKTVSLSNGKAVVIIGEVTVNAEKWFQISFTFNDSKLKGYVPANKVIFRTAEESTSIKTGTVNASSLRVRAEAGTDQAQLEYNAQQVKLVKGQPVTILATKVVDTVTWYQVSFTYDNTTLTGYVSGQYITVDGSTATPTPSEVPTATTSPSATPVASPTTKPTTTPSVSPTPVATPAESFTPLSDVEFEQSLVNQGFPESYKPYLRTLHQQYPYWQFTALQTGLDWNAVIMAENIIGKNLISNSKTIAWKSLEAKAYNWETDKFVPYDGSTWVTASKQAVEYYMDPRNFLTPRSVFQFESLEYRSDYQKQPGVEKILSSTPLYNTKYSFLDTVTGLNTECTYSETFIKAAEYSGVSPYHLASRVKQEVVTGPTTMSSIVSGTVPGYEGYYNFYNIGAFHSTVSGGALANGLKYAMNGSTSATNNALFLIPWNNQYKAILGGAKFIGNNYINRGQNTGYLQKFNVTNYSQFNHQYMANVEAANSEAAKTFTAYSGLGDVPIVFSIPVYLNMPASQCPAPSGGSNPNNWLRSISVAGYFLTPSFSVPDAGNVEYTVIVENAVTSVNLSATAVSTTATVTGTGMITLAVGTNKAIVQVTAQNGNIKNYTVNIIRNAATTQ